MKLLSTVLLAAMIGNPLPPVNIDYMIRGHFYAASPYLKDLEGAGGWGGSENMFKPVGAGLPVNNNRFEVYIDTTAIADWGNGFAAHKVYVINTGGDTLFFQAQDSRLNMVVEARDRDGQWKPIEYLPNSWCGNSYHKLFLPTGKYWEFKTPVHTGKFETSLRVSLSYGRDAKNRKSETIYSNEIKGGINPGQFHKKKEYKPNGVMDPYLD